MLVLRIINMYYNIVHCIAYTYEAYLQLHVITKIRALKIMNI